MENNEQIMICECSSVEHQIVFSKFEDDDFVYCMIHLKKLSFFKRLIHGIKYIFGYKCRYGDFEEFMLGKKNINKLKEIINLIENGTE
jgi:hypothetical protein